MTQRRLIILIAVLAVAAFAAAATTVEAHVRWHGGVHIGVGPFWWPYSYGWYPGPYYYGYPPVYWHPPPVQVEVEPPVYIEAPRPQSYWYYCAPSQAYYPHVPTCTEPWIQVPARSR